MNFIGKVVASSAFRLLGMPVCAVVTSGILWKLLLPLLLIKGLHQGSPALFRLGEIGRRL